MSIFQKPNSIRHYTDWMTIHGFHFKADLDICSKRGNPLAIHGGRIIYFALTIEEVTVALFDDGRWILLPDDSFDEAQIAVSVLIEKWRGYNPKKEDCALITRGEAE